MKRQFTLVELVVVCVICGIILALTVPAFHRWGANRRAEESVRRVTRALHLARSFAIAHRRQVAVLLPESGDRLACCEVGAGWTFQGLVRDTAPMFLEQVGVVGTVTGDIAVQGVDLSILGGAGTGPCRAIVFRPNGAVAGPEDATPTIAVVDGVYADGRLVMRSARTWLIEIERYTGRASVERAE